MWTEALQNRHGTGALRRLTLLAALLCLWAGLAAADSFNGSLPAALSGCLDGSAFAGDRVSQGAWRTERGLTTALLAVTHEDTRLLVAACRAEGANTAWSCYPLTEAPPEDMAIGLDTFRLTGDEVWFALRTADGTFYLAVDTGDAFLVGYEAERNSRFLAIDTRQVNALRVVEGAPGTSGSTRSLRCAFNPFTETVNFESFPTTLAAAESYARAHPLIPDTLLRVIGGMNLRAEPTSRSESLAIYRNPVYAVYMDEVDGLVEPWIQVRIGQESGWVTSAYVHYVHENAAYPLGAGLAVGELQADTPFYPLRGSEASGMLSAGTRLHVLTEEKNGWVQVCVPQGELTAEMDTAGEIGWVAAASVRVARSPLQMKYGCWEEGS